MLASEMITRTLAEWLYPGGDESPQFDFLVDAIDDDPATVDLELEGRVEFVPKDSVIQIGSELILVKSTSGSAVTAASRAWATSTIAEHAAGALVEIDPDFTRIEILHALRALVAKLQAWGLYKRTVDSSLVSTFDEVIELPTGTREVHSILIRKNQTDEDWYPLRHKGVDWVEFKEFDPIKIKLRRGIADQPMRVVCKGVFTMPDDEAFNLTTEGGLSEELQEDMPMAVAGMVLKGREVPRAYVDRIREILAAEGLPPGAIIDVGETLLGMFRRDAVMAERRRLDELDEPTFEWQRR